MSNQIEQHTSSPSSGPFSGWMEICQLITESDDWKHTLDLLIPFLRKQIIFDNFVIYQDKPGAAEPSEVIYARAVGRGKSAGEFLSWGESLAAKVLINAKMEINQPPLLVTECENISDRLELPYILGLPAQVDAEKYAIILIRFGGPEYNYIDKLSAGYLACQISQLLKQKQLREKLTTLEQERQLSILQEDFISIISHELLSPIGFIKGYTTTLMRSDTTWTPEVQGEFLTVIDEETDRLQELIDNLLDSARLQSGSLSMDNQPVRLPTLLRDVVMRAVAHQPNLAIQFDQSTQIPSFLGDSRRLTQVFENLISNVMKYAPGSNLIIKAGLVNDRIHISFADDGPGIAPKQIPNLFKKFARVTQDTPTVAGTGLGLYICKQIIQAHNGEIFAESELGKGLTIHILLPVPITEPVAGED